MSDPSTSAISTSTFSAFPLRSRNSLPGSNVYDSVIVPSLGAGCVRAFSVSQGRASLKSADGHGVNPRPPAGDASGSILSNLNEIIRNANHSHLPEWVLLGPGANGGSSDPVFRVDSGVKSH